MAFEHNHRDAKAVREIVGLLFTEKFDKMAGDKFHNALSEYAIMPEKELNSLLIHQKISIQNQSILATHITFVDAKPMVFWALDPFDFSIGDKVLKLTQWTEFHKDTEKRPLLKIGTFLKNTEYLGIPIKEETRFQLYKSGKMQMAITSKEATVDNYKLKPGTLYFQEKGGLASGQLAQQTFFPSLDAFLPKDSTILFDKKKSLNHFALGDEARLFSIKWHKGTTFNFHKKMWVVHGNQDFLIGKYQIPKNSQISFANLSGDLASIDVFSERRWDGHDEYRYFYGNDNYLFCEKASFHPGNIIKTCAPYGHRLYLNTVIYDTNADDYTPTIQIKEDEYVDDYITLSNKHKIHFYENSNLKSGYIYDTQKIDKKKCGLKKSFTPVKFYENGNIKSCVRRKKQQDPKSLAFLYNFRPNGKTKSKEVY